MLFRVNHQVAASEARAVAELKGAKGAMEASLHRIAVLEERLARTVAYLDDAAKAVGDALYVRTHYGSGNYSPDNPLTPLAATMRAHAAKIREVL